MGIRERKESKNTPPAIPAYDPEPSKLTNDYYIDYMQAVRLVTTEH